MKINHGVLFFFLLLVGWNPAIMAQEPGNKQLLQYKLAADDSWVMNLRIETKTSHTAAGYPALRHLLVDLQLACKVLELDSQGNATVEVNYSSVSLKEKTPFEANEYSSVNPTGDLSPNAKGLADLAGQAFRLTISPGGEVSEVRNQTPKKTTGSNLFNLLALLGSGQSNFWESSVKESLIGLFRAMPADPVGVNDTWRKTIILPFGNFAIRGESGLEVIQLTQETVVKVSGDMNNNIHIKNDIKSSNNNQAYSSEVDYSLQGDLKGEISWSVKSGWLNRADLNARLNGSVKQSQKSIPFTLEVQIVLSTVNR